MGKNKKQKVEVINAFSRMNYLYQASIIASKTVPYSILGNYYGRLMKEVSKKVVEKIHPYMKRSLCICCSYPSFTGCDYGSSKIKPFKKKKSKRKKSSKVHGYVKKLKETQSERKVKKDYFISQKAKKNVKPNKLLWTCNKCGYLRKFLQHPLHNLWIEKFEGIYEDNL